MIFQSNTALNAYRTVGEAFSDYLRDCVNLSPELVKQALSSRDYLLRILAGRSQDDPEFPTLTGHYLNYGSFARDVKRQPLDDIDLMLLLNGSGTTEWGIGEGSSILRPHSILAPLVNYVDQSGNINSTQILHRIRDSLAEVRTYKKADIHKNMNAVTVQLQSYDWKFDIVPSIPVSLDGRAPYLYFIIPDGKGGWIRTDPRFDARRIGTINQQNNGLVCLVIRLLKAWNDRGGKVSLKSYYLESIALDIFSQTKINSVVGGINKFFQDASYKILLPHPDPKGLGPNIDLEVDLGSKLSMALAIDAAKEASTSAIFHQALGNHYAAIRE